MDISLKGVGLIAFLVGLLLLMAGAGGSFYSAALAFYVGPIGMISILVGILLIAIDDIKRKRKDKE